MIKKINQVMVFLVAISSLVMTAHAMEQPNPTNPKKPSAPILCPRPIRAVPTGSTPQAPDKRIIIEQCPDGELVPIFFRTSENYTPAAKRRKGAPASDTSADALLSPDGTSLLHQAFAEEMADEPSSSLSRPDKVLLQPVHVRGGYQCPSCEFTCADPSNCRKHINIKHLGIRRQCPYCHKNYTVTATLKKHIKKHHRDQWTES